MDLIRWNRFNSPSEKYRDLVGRNDDVGGRERFHFLHRNSRTCVFVSKKESPIWVARLVGARHVTDFGEATSLVCIESGAWGFADAEISEDPVY